MSAKANGNNLSITINQQTGERKVDKSEPDSKPLRKNHVVKPCPPRPRRIEVLSSIPVKRAIGKRKAEVLESELESESESSVQLPNERPEMISCVPVDSDQTEVKRVETEFSIPLIPESRMHPKAAEVLESELESESESSVQLPNERPEMISCVPVDSDQTEVKSVETEFSIPLIPESRMHPKAVEVMKQKIKELDCPAPCKKEPNRSVEVIEDPTRLEIRKEIRKIERKEHSRRASSRSQQSGVWKSLRDKITAIKLNSIVGILDLKNKMSIGRLEGMFAVASDSYQSHNEIQSMLTTDGLKVVLQKDFDDYVNSLMGIVYNYKKNTCAVGTLLEHEVNSVIDVAEAKVPKVKQESPKVVYRTKFLALWGMFVTFLIFLDMCVLPDDMEISPSFVYATVVFVSAIFLLPILFIKRMY